MNNKVHVKTGDEVIVINGKNRGMKGKVLQVSPAEGKVIVEGVNIVTKHVKPRKMGDPGGIIEAEPLARIDYVEVVDGVTMQPTDAIGAMALVAMAVYIGPKCGRPTRIGHAINSKGKKVRTCKKSDCLAQFE